MKWSSIITFFSYESIIKKAKIIIFFVPVIALFYNYGFKIENYKTLLIGACLVLFSYLLLQLSAPQIIKTHKTEENYIKHLLINKATINILEDFSVLDDFKSHRLLDFDVKNYLPVHEAIRILNAEQLIPKYGKAVFRINDNNKTIIRIVIISFFLLGTILMYFLLIKNIFLLILS